MTNAKMKLRLIKTIEKSIEMNLLYGLEEFLKDCLNDKCITLDEYYYYLSKIDLNHKFYLMGVLK